MKLTEEQIQELEEFASWLFPLRKLEILMHMPEGTLETAMLEESEEGLAVMRGRLKTQAQLRKVNIELAIKGSSPAQQMVAGYIEEMQIEDG